ncbi:MAG: two-component regulator propeller domain-containing protein [Bacteroidales bacterium]|nr:two-component regulator propeller domain-containing protein [Bacteroidales bacterium]
MRYKFGTVIIALMVWPVVILSQVKRIDIPKNLYAFTFQEDPTGKVWVGLSDGNITGALGYVNDSSFVQVSGSDDLPNGSYHSSIRLADGSLMFGGNLVDQHRNSLLAWVTSEKPDTIRIPYRLTNPFINSFALVNRHELWIGTGSGLVVNNRGKWSHFSVANGLPDNFITSIYQDFRGTVWIGSEVGIAFYQDNQIHRIPPGARIISSVTQIFGDNRGYVWCGSRFTSEGISVYNGGLWETFSGRHGLVDNSSSIFFQAPDGLLWVGSCYNRSRGGVSVFNGHKWESFTSEDVLAKPCVDAIAADSQGRIWLGGSLSPRREKGITIYEDGTWIQLTNSNELPAERVLKFFLDSKNRFWISSFEGLFVIDPEFKIN